MPNSIVEILETLEDALEHCDLNNLHLAAIHLSSAIAALREHATVNVKDIAGTDSSL